MLLILLILFLLVGVGVGVVLYVRKTGEVDRGNFKLFEPYLNKFNVFEKDERGKFKLNTYDDWVLELKYHKELCDFAIKNKPTKTKNWYHPNINAFKGCGKKVYDQMREDVESIATYRTDGDITGICSVNYENTTIEPTIFELLPEEERNAIKEACKNNFNSSQ